MSAPIRGLIENAISCRVAYPATTDSDVPGREGSTTAQQALYDSAYFGFRVLVSSNGNRYTKTSMTKYADGGRITQEDTGGGAAGIDGTYSCGVGVAVGEAVYLSGSGAVTEANATSATTAPAIGIVVSKPTTTTCVVRSFGSASVFTTLTPGSVYYLDTTAGQLTTTAPSSSGNVVQRIGIATSATTLLVQIDGQTNLGVFGSSDAPTYGFAGAFGAGTGLFLAGVQKLGFAAAGATVGQITTAGLSVLQGVQASGSPNALFVSGAAHTSLDASVPSPDVYFRLDRTVTFSAGAMPNQMAVYAEAPTWAFTAPSVITNGSTFYIDGAPVAGANATISNSYAVFIGSGRVRFDGVVVQNSIPVLQSTTDTSGAPNIATPAGIVRVPSGSSSVTVTCAACTANTLLWGSIRNATTNSVQLMRMVPGAGSFDVVLTGNPGASNADVAVYIAQPGTGT